MARGSVGISSGGWRRGRPSLALVIALGLSAAWVTPGLAATIGGGDDQTDFGCNVSYVEDGNVVFKFTRMDDLGKVPQPFNPPPDAEYCESVLADGETIHDTDPSLYGGRPDDPDPPLVGKPINDRDVRFLATADPQFYHSEDENQDEEEGYNRAARVTLIEMKRMLADSRWGLYGALVAGDLTQNGRLDEWMEFRSHIDDTVGSSPQDWAPPGLYGETEHTGYPNNDIYLPSPAGGLNRFFYDTVGNHDLGYPFHSGCGLVEPSPWCTDTGAMSREIRDRYRSAVETGEGASGRYSWDWHDVHFVSVGLGAMDGGLDFLVADLAENVGANSRRPVVIMGHYGFDEISTEPTGEWWTAAQRAELWEQIKSYNVVAFITGHSHPRPDDSWKRPFWNPGGPNAGSYNEDCDPAAEVTVDGERERACIPGYVAGAARFHPPPGSSDTDERGAFIAVRIGSDDTTCTGRKPDWGHACLSATRYGVNLAGTVTVQDSDRRVVAVSDADLTPPYAKPSGFDAWNRPGVKVFWNWEDDETAPVPSECPLYSIPSGEGFARPVSATCKDDMENQGTATAYVNVDGTDPTANPTSPPPVTGSGGWYADDVTVTWNWFDVLSGIDEANCQATSRSTGEGPDLTVTGTCKDNAGNDVTLTIGDGNVDKSPPVAGEPTMPPPVPDSGGWYADDVPVTWTWTDKYSGIDPAACTMTATSSGEGAEVKVPGVTCTDKVGHQGTSAPVTVKIDKRAPDATPTHPAEPASGWYREDVVVTWNWSDAHSGIDAAACPATSTSDGEGREVSVTAKCKDKVGHEQTVTRTFKVDKSPPTIKIGVPADGASFDLEQEVAASYECDDGDRGSGIVECVGDKAHGAPLDTANAGEHTFTVVARDTAGNESVKTVSYTVRKAPTTITAEPLLLKLEPGRLSLSAGQVSARLTYGPQAKPAAGRRIAFSTGSTALCTALTGSDGRATCSFGIIATLTAVLRFGYTARFDGDANLLPSSAHAGLGTVGGLPLF